ncbi:hypothetical protein F0562_009918 [Nyssa sinensis]|uniref:Uncharacterized protein n=1 Tax=Nyssa sinensis TaxID=561372 RepID=A0A5J4ZXF7_9ASTE|nr:hypothetical protein F0562_009918 [Nyssa sinensis]
MARTMLSFMVKLLAYMRSLPFEMWRRQNNVHPSNVIEDKPDGRTHDSEAITVEDRVLPCVKRLQRLETLLEELSKKPAEIPLEKDQMLLQSLDRIKSIEFDLEKTKRVLHATVMKQLEITELLEKLQESKFRQRRRSCKKECLAEDVTGSGTSIEEWQGRQPFFPAHPFYIESVLLVFFLCNSFSVFVPFDLSSLLLLLLLPLSSQMIFLVPALLQRAGTSSRPRKLAL